MKNKKVGIDLRFFQNSIFRERGIGRYADCLLSAISKLVSKENPCIEYIGYDYGNSNKFFPAEPLLPFSKKGLIQQHLKYPLKLISKKIHLIHYLVHDQAAVYSKQPYIVTVHDLIPVKFPQLSKYRGKKRSIYLKIVKKILIRAKAIIAISNATKNDIIDCFNIEPNKIEVIYHGIEEIYKPINKNEAGDVLLTKYGIEDQFLLYLGGFDSRKNVANLIDVFSNLKKEGVEQKLICVGPPAPYQSFIDVINTIAKNRLQKDVILTGYVPTGDLPLFYSAADLFLFPSSYEGFGFPVLEAMACGAPVIAFKNSSLVELIGSAGCLVESFDQMAEVAKMLIQDSNRSESLIRNGLSRAKLFKWKNAAEKVISVYKSNF